MSSVHIDFGREERLGFPEVVYARGKSIPALIQIIQGFQQKTKPVLLTHLSKEKKLALHEQFDDLFYDEVSHIAMFPESSEVKGEPLVGILSGGTSDEAVVNETFYTLQFMGISTKRFQDIGVAGLHRFTSNLDEIRKMKIIIVVAGFEGALASVAGGMLPQPIIAVPTSVGYGVSKGGKTALNAMLASCANGITVVNIDNGYGAAMAAVRMVNVFGKIDRKSK